MLARSLHTSHPPFQQSHEHLAPATMTTTSLPILPSATPSRPTLPPLQTSPSKKPKLSLNTEQVPQVHPYSRASNTSLRLDTLSAVSPTSRNTFSNTYEHSKLAGPFSGKPSKPRFSVNSSVPLQDPERDATPTVQTASTLDSASISSASTTSAFSTESATIHIPYKQPHHLNSILSNSPHIDLQTRRMTSGSRPIFPASKRVSFSEPLTEEIKTVKYTLAHSDIESSETSTISSIASIDSEQSSNPSSNNSEQEISLSVSSSSESSSQTSSKPSSKTPKSKGPQTGDKRDSSSEESDSDSCPETPVAGRRKRRREWVWTLGPVGKASSSSSPTMDNTVSDESD